MFNSLDHRQSLRSFFRYCLFSFSLLSRRCNGLATTLVVAKTELKWNDALGTQGFCPHLTDERTWPSVIVPSRLQTPTPCPAAFRVLFWIAKCSEFGSPRRPFGLAWKSWRYWAHKHGCNRMHFCVIELFTKLSYSLSVESKTVVKFIRFIIFSSDQGKKTTRERNFDAYRRKIHKYVRPVNPVASSSEIKYKTIRSYEPIMDILTFCTQHGFLSSLKWAPKRLINHHHGEVVRTTNDVFVIIKEPS